MSKIYLKSSKFSSWISLDLDLGKIIKPCNSFLAKVRESQGTWEPKSQRESGNFAKIIG